MPASIRKICLTAIASLCVGVAQAQEFDIVGLKLGMTLPEVKSVLKDYGVDPNIQEHRQYYNYSDGVEHFKTEDFVSYIDAMRSGDSTDNLAIFFSPGPKGGRVVAITRTVNNRINPPTRSQYLDALKKKYGAPTAEDISTVQWDFPEGKQQCVVGAVGSYMPTQPSILKKIYGANVGSRDGVLHNQKAKSLADCASYITYAMPSGDTSLATDVRAVMIDVAGTAEGELSANEWVASLAEQARKARAAKSVAPTL